MSTKAQAAKARKLNRQAQKGQLQKKTRNYNRCEISGRTRGYIRYFGLSRIAFRDMARAGLIPGVRKASW